VKKTFPLTAPNHAPARVVEQIKHELRKYLKRERSKPRPEGVDFWDFDCRVGATSESAEAKHVEELIPAIDAVAAAASPGVYVEILAKPGRRGGAAG
jgi:hypothetical protein